MSQVYLDRGMLGLVGRSHNYSPAVLRSYLRQHQPSTIPSEITKRFLDFIVAMIGLLILAPLIVMIIALLLALQGRPIFIAHRRVGKNGVMFPCFKFRTMVRDAEAVLAQSLERDPSLREEWTSTNKLREDPRITPFGTLLRRTSFDEVPQLFNVVRGEMSIVGPRPIVAREAERYGAHFFDYVKVRPGLTGLWQISGRSDTTYSERIRLDVKYISRRNLVDDLFIMLKTVPAVLRQNGSC